MRSLNASGWWAKHRQEPSARIITASNFDACYKAHVLLTAAAGLRPNAFEHELSSGDRPRSSCEWTKAPVEAMRVNGCWISWRNGMSKGNKPVLQKSNRIAERKPQQVDKHLEETLVIIMLVLIVVCGQQLLQVTSEDPRDEPLTSIMHVGSGAHLSPSSIPSGWKTSWCGNLKRPAPDR